MSGAKAAFWMLITRSYLFIDKYIKNTLSNFSSAVQSVKIKTIS